MKIEKVIEELQKIHAEYGNIDVLLWASANEASENIRVCVDEEETRGELTREEALERFSENAYLVNGIYDSGKFLKGNKGTGRMIAYIVED